MPVLPSSSRPAMTRRGSHQTPQHGRSISTPFSALHGSSDMSARVNGVNESFSGHNALPDESRVNITIRDSEKDLAKGSCATCDTQVRWPKDLDTFRCTICLMINDRNPSTGGSTEGRDEASNINNSSSILQTSFSKGQLGIIHPPT